MEQEAKKEDRRDAERQKIADACESLLRIYRRGENHREWPIDLPPRLAGYVLGFLAQLEKAERRASIAEAYIPSRDFGDYQGDVESGK